MAKLKKQTTIEKLGIRIRPKIDRAECERRVKRLTRGIEKDEYTPRLREVAIRYRAYYKWLAAHGGTRGTGFKR
jgi:translation initiation factor IF-3